jgi:hypothetical protein
MSQEVNVNDEIQEIGLTDEELLVIPEIDLLSELKKVRRLDLTNISSYFTKNKIKNLRY